MKKIIRFIANTACCWFVYAALLPTWTSAAQTPTFDVARDFSATANPAGPWSYGWKGTIGGGFNIFPFFTREGGDNGVLMDLWAKAGGGPSAAYDNATTNTSR